MDKDFSEPGQQDKNNIQSISVVQFHLSLKR